MRKSELQEARESVERAWERWDSARRYYESLVTEAAEHIASEAAEQLAVHDELTGRAIAQALKAYHNAGGIR